MKKIIILIISLMTFNQFAIAEDATDYYNSGWDRYMIDYNLNQIDKPVTPQEFDKAVQTIKDLQESSKKNKDKKDKKNKKNKKKKNSEFEENPDQPPIEKKFELPVIPPSSDPLLRLPFNLYYNKIVIRDGFYLISAVKKDGKYLIRFNQGYKNIAEIPASIINDDKAPKVSGVSTEIIDSNQLRIIFKNIDVALESYLTILKD